MNGAIIGATGAVGEQILHLLEKRAFPVQNLTCFASPGSVGKTVLFRGRSIPIQTLSERSFDDVDLAFFCAGASVSRQYVPIARRAKTFVVDSSSAFRQESDVPLVIPEINAHALQSAKGLAASPNCAATMLLMPLYPLHRLYRVKRIVAATYQAASGAGARLMRDLLEETKAYLEGKFDPHSTSVPYAFNLFPHNSELHENGYVEEECKMLFETRKILEDESIQLSATCVRVPVLRAHSIAANVEFHRPVSIREAESAIASMPGVRLFQDRSKNRFPTPRDASGIDEVLCGRLRIDAGQPNTLEFWSVGDQLLKGAALNAVQIAELVEELLPKGRRFFLRSRDRSG
jgi:aspartate-semialdehyde dehydrogenase